MSEEQITQQMKRLLYLIAEYTKLEDKYGALAIKELPVLSLIFKGILNNILDYDYAPQSVMYMDNRRFLNISREGEDDLDDLRDVKLLKKIRLATQRHVFIYAYNLTESGIKYLDSIPREDKDAIDHLVYCKCGNLYNIQVQPEGVFMICNKCNIKIDTGITDIEDVAYKCSPIKIRTRLTRKSRNV
ncbi:MAG: hypothetical protein ACFFDN_21895 [Candidatus Hodarchaeota archaeon]